MSRQSFLILVYGLGVMALFQMNAPVYAALVAMSLLIAAPAEQVVACAQGLFGNADGDDPEALSQVHDRICN